MAKENLSDSTRLNMFQTFEWFRKRSTTKKEKYKELIQDYMEYKGTDDPMICLPEGDYGFNTATNILSTFLFAPNIDEFFCSESPLADELELFIHTIYELRDEVKANQEDKQHDSL
jgi:hypothetical protein